MTRETKKEETVLTHLRKHPLKLTVCLKLSVYCEIKLEYFIENTVKKRNYYYLDKVQLIDNVINMNALCLSSSNLSI